MTTKMPTRPLSATLALAASMALAACGDAPSEQSAAPETADQAEPVASAVVDPAPPAFAVCRSCHSTQDGQNGIGPTLFGIYGKKAGSAPGYAFSPALKSSGVTWDRATLDTWLEGPSKMVPGTKMVIPVADPAKRKAIIDYLETLK